MNRTLACSLTALLASSPAWAAPSKKSAAAKTAESAAWVAKYYCGLRDLVYKDPSTGQATQVTVYYPTTTGELAQRRDLYTLSVAENAPALDGKLPVIVFSHGSGGTTLTQHDIVESLARHGFVVVVPLHAGNNHFDHSGEGSARMWRGRPLALKAALDAIVADSKLGPHLDLERVGAAGFSTGGYTALVAGGASADMSLLAKHCAAHAAEDEDFCSHGAGAPSDGDAQVRAADPRIRAVAAMAPVGALFPDDAFAAVKGAGLVYRAEKDDVLKQPFHAERVHKLWPTAEYTVVANAGHYAFMTPFPTGLGPGGGPFDVDPPGFDRAAFHEKLDDQLARFFRQALAPAGGAAPAESSSAK